MADFPDIHNPPQVAVIIPARNEAMHLDRLVSALLQQDYPLEHVQLLFANDRSEDATGDILEAWAKQFPNAYVLHITETYPGLFGKANALGQLCRLANAPYMLFTDADCTPPPTWIRSMVRKLQQLAPNPHSQAHIVTGVTVPTYTTVFSTLQAVDWISALSVIHLLSKAGVPVTAMGNNMGCTQAAYQKSGGFEATASSLTEDYTFFKNIIAVGSTFSHIMDTSVLVETLPQPNPAAWMAQRKRWFTGALQLPWHTQFPFWFQVCSYPLFILAGILCSVKLAFALWATKIVCQSLLFGYHLVKLKHSRLLPWLLPYDLWISIASMKLLWAYTQNPQLEWKGVKYEPTEQGYRPS